jgi:hypothetical protein
VRRRNSRAWHCTWCSGLATKYSARYQHLDVILVTSRLMTTISRTSRFRNRQRIIAELLAQNRIHCPTMSLQCFGVICSTNCLRWYVRCVASSIGRPCKAYAAQVRAVQYRWAFHPLFCRFSGLTTPTAIAAELPSGLKCSLQTDFSLPSSLSGGSQRNLISKPTRTLRL